jgi:queuine tRNA-ribosyltransferase
VTFEVVAHDPDSGMRVGILRAPRDVASTGARVVLSNTYHLMLQPGIDTVERLGGLHALMRWNGPMLTDSGGFQIFSLDSLRQVSDAGVTFASHLDGARMWISPECVVDAQERLGADLIMPLDECLGVSASRSEAEIALDRTRHWFERSLASRRNTDQALFALLQGGLFADLRREHARAASALNPPGFAIGGLSIGEPKSITAELLQVTISELPDEKPRYLMGVGHPRDLASYARLGVDLFDCVLPTRLARNGTVWRDAEGTRVDLGRATLRGCTERLDRTCPCAACTNWSLGALATLFQSREPLAYRLASVHNLTLLARVLEVMRHTVLYTATQTPMARKALHT